MQAIESLAPTPQLQLSRLDKSQLPQIAAHLQRLSPEDRYLRFFCQMSDTALTHYLDSIDFAKDEVLGWWQDDQLIGMMHLACERQTAAPACEVGLSVDQAYRGRGLGTEFVKAAIELGRAQHIPKLTFQFLWQNTGMAHLARHFGLTLKHAADEITAALSLE